MTKQDDYKPFRGVEYAYSPEKVEAMNERPEDLGLVLDINVARPAYTSVKSYTYNRGAHVITKTRTIITNRPTNITYK